MKRKLFLDFDGTISDSVKAVCDLYNSEMWGYPDYKFAYHELVDRWDFLDECPLVNADTYFIREELFSILKPFKDAIETIKKLSEQYDIYICTIGELENLGYKTKWIKKYLPFVKNVILLSNDGIKMDKSIIDMNNSVFIDDNEKNLFSSNAVYKICFGEVHSWNRNWNGIRCRDWNEVYNILKKN